MVEYVRKPPKKSISEPGICFPTTSVVPILAIGWAVILWQPKIMDVKRIGNRIAESRVQGASRTEKAYTRLR